MTDHDDFAGMTVNERLDVAGLIAAFDDAVSRRDRAAMIRILERVGLVNPGQTADAVLSNPAFYGYGKEPSVG